MTQKRKKKVLRAKYIDKAKADAKVKQMRAEGRKATVERHNGYYYVYEVIFLALVLGIFGSLLRGPQQ